MERSILIIYTGGTIGMKQDPVDFTLKPFNFGQILSEVPEIRKFVCRVDTYSFSPLIDSSDAQPEFWIDLARLIKKEYANYDGFVVHPEKWREEFLNYDYIGSPWPVPKPGTKHCYHDIYGNLCRVGNSVSLRSKRLLEFPRKAELKWEMDEDGFYNEDIFLCCMNKHKIEEAGMRIAPVEVASYFGHEHPVPEVQEVDAPFVFHKWWGRNEQYPRFENPWTRRWLRFKDRVRPLLFWRRIGKG